VRPFIEVVEAIVDSSRRGAVSKDPKTHMLRSIDLSPSTARLLRELRQQRRPDPDELVFTSLRGQVLSWGKFRDKVRGPAIRSLGLGPQRANVLRHTSGSLLAALGLPLHQVKEQMGYASITTTEKYLHVYRDLELPTVPDLTTFKQRDIIGTLLKDYFDATSPIASLPAQMHQRP
jgi:site-specific recombinase XerD